MINADDLKNIDFFLSEYEKVTTHTEGNRKMANTIRTKIANELAKVLVRIEKKVLK